MTWQSQVPTEPGRYFFRDTESYEYGLALVAWDGGVAHGDFVRQPELKVQATVIWGTQHPEDWRNHSGENTDHPGWSYSLGAPRITDAMEFWSLPLATPGGIPEVRGQPPAISEEKIAEERVKSEQCRAEQKAREREREAKRHKARMDARQKGHGLYECDDCGELWRDDELVVGKLRECPHCSTTFVAPERNCPDCNRPFTRVEEERASCPSCIDAGELPEITTVVAPAGTRFP